MKYYIIHGHKLQKFTAGDGQWRSQDLLRGGAKLEIMSWGTHGELQGRPGAAAAR